MNSPFIAFLHFNYTEDNSVIFLFQQQSIEKPAPGNDVMYISIGQAPVACLLLLDEMLWCASGNTVYIIHAR